MAAFLGQIGRGKIYRQMLVGHAEPDSMKCVADPLAALGDGLVRQAHDNEGFFPRRRPCLDFDSARLDPDERDSRHGSVFLGFAPHYPPPAHQNRERMKPSESVAESAELFRV